MGFYYYGQHSRRRRIVPAKVRYELDDEFSVALAAGSVNGTTAEPGPGTRTVQDTDSKLSISSRLLNIAPHSTPAWGQPGLRYGAISRAAGKMLLWKMNHASGNNLGMGWNNAADFPVWNGLDNGLRGAAGLITYGATSLSTFATQYGSDVQICLVLKTTGCYYFIKGGDFTNWTLLWIDATQSTATLYPTISNYDGTLTWDYIRIPWRLFLPTPLAYDTFTRANGAIGTSESTGPDSQSCSQRTWTDRVGTTQIATNAASASALVGSLAICTVDTNTVNAIVDAALTRSAGNVGIVLRYADSDNYVCAYHDGTNANLDKVVGGVTTSVIQAAKAYSASAVIRVIPDDTSFALFYNNSKIGSTSTISDAGLQTGTEQGLYSSNTSNTQPDFAVFARGSDNEYRALDDF